MMLLAGSSPFFMADNFRFSEMIVKSDFGFSKLPVFLNCRKMAAMDYRLIARTIDLRGLSKSGLASALKIPNSAVTELLKGNRRLLADEVPIVRRYLKLDTVPLKGYVAAGAEATFFPLPDDDLDRVEAPEDATEKTVAVEIRGESLGALFDRWLVYYDDVHRPITQALIGQLCVVGLPDGRVLIKRVQKTKTKGLFHLISNNDAPILDVPIEWAAKVKKMGPR